MKDEKPKSNLVLIILLTALITAILVAGGIFIYLKFKNYEQTIQKLGQPTSTPTPTPTTTKTFQEQTKESSKQVVENFIKYSLGTLPGADVNFNAARALLTDDLKARYTDPSSFAAEFYGIQDGPTSVKYISEYTSGDTSTVRYDASWGEMSMAWAFILTKNNNQWLISQFRNDAQ